MIGIDVVIAEISGLKQQDLERWISNAWVRPDKSASGYAFREIDVARARLILEMRDEMQISEDALPVVLLLLLLDGAEVFVGPRTVLPWTNSNGVGCSSAASVLSSGWIEEAR